MHYRSITSLIILMAVLASAAIVVDARADNRPDDTPFGLDNDHWYRDGWRTTPFDIDRSVDSAFRSMGPDVELDLVVQFKPPLTEEDLEAAREAGLEIVSRLDTIPVLRARGTRDAVEKISRYPGIYWIENNTMLEYQMEMSTTTINASKTWESPIIDALGKEYPGIDGSGVTAVVLDSGIDAGHPDLDLGEKVIKNYKSDTGDVWREVENGDTSSGHGTHCAGTVAGNGDASSGARKGVAPGASLIGLSVGEGPSIIAALEGMEWVYEHSKPGHTYEWPDPIRVVSNSWGPSPGDYDPEDSISKISQKITFENNVVVVFAASNSGGDGSEIETNPYGNVPSNIAVAALERDGSGVASFSSRGQKGVQTTYPDIGAPGVRIWSTAARRTFISLMTKQGASSISDIDPYYFAISGTSMATPHIAGVVALLFQANEDLGMSHLYDDADQEKMDAGWLNDTRNRVHEVELILEASAKYLSPSDGEAPLAGNNVPQNFSVGWNGKPFDLAQGYGMVQVDRAVGIALAMKELRTRDFDGDGLVDLPDACVRKSAMYYEQSMTTRDVTFEGNKLYSAWDGEWSRFSNQTNQVIPVQHDTSKMVYIPEGAQELELRFSYTSWSTLEKSAASLYATIDHSGDGRADWVQDDGSLLDSTRFSTISLSGLPTGQYWSINVEGRGVDWDLGSRVRDSQFKEVRVEFTISLNLTFGPGAHSLPPQDSHSQYAYWKPLGNEVDGTSVNLTQYVYDLGLIDPTEDEGAGDEGGGGLTWLWVLIILAVLGAVGYYIWSKKKGNRSKAHVSGITEKEEVTGPGMGPSEEHDKMTSGETESSGALPASGDEDPSKADDQGEKP